MGRAYRAMGAMTGDRKRKDGGAWERGRGEWGVFGEALFNYAADHRRRGGCFLAVAIFLVHICGVGFSQKLKLNFVCVNVESVVFIRASTSLMLK